MTGKAYFGRAGVAALNIGEVNTRSDDCKLIFFSKEPPGEGQAVFGETEYQVGGSK